ncbi:MAG: AbrB/MazE/SpoVT family DNA-binding domain-containing protein [Acidobacteria bacterium]|nr:AbrB/MazE/SpoVT family DNA-binding domain-containing protein [Acidobacteriota bacterium]
MRTTIDQAGRVTIPKAVRERAGLTPGVELDIEYRDGRVEIEAVSRIKLARRGSLLVAVAPPGTPPVTHGQVNRTIRALRERRS